MDSNIKTDRISCLALGTVQFGLDYGISNPDGKTSEENVRALLQHVTDAGLSLIDTAAAYGESEKVLGETLPSGHTFKIVTKTEPLSSEIISKNDISRVRDRFMQSLELMKVSSVYGLMVHHSENLLSPGGENLAKFLYAMRDEGLTHKIGVSVYSPQSAIELTERFKLDLIQAPINIFDQQFVNSGCFAKLHSSGIEIHARSIFLQGLLLMKPEELPEHLSPLADKLSSLIESVLSYNISPLEAAISFVFGIKEISKVVIGICDIKQLDEIITAISKTSEYRHDYSHLAISDEKLINPSCWDSLKQS